MASCSTNGVQATDNRYLPGQHTRISVLRDGEVVSRRYTLSSSALDGHFRISVKRESTRTQHGRPAGLMSNHLHDILAVGDVIHAGLPAGSFHADPEDETPLWLISMGIGITPMISVMRERRRAGRDRAGGHGSVHQLQATRRAEERSMARRGQVPDHALPIHRNHQPARPRRRWRAN